MLYYSDLVIVEYCDKEADLLRNALQLGFEFCKVHIENLFASKGF